ncbi:MAG: hypothetical protein ACRC62_07315 [Microcoleus sp.]
MVGALERAVRASNEISIFTVRVNAIDLQTNKFALKRTQTRVDSLSRCREESLLAAIAIIIEDLS